MIKEIVKKYRSGDGVLGGFTFEERKPTGFTLVELLIVIAIIGVLAGAVLLAINPAEILRESRDAQRLSDLDTIAKALNLALADNEIQITACASNCTSASGSQVVDGSGYVTFSVVGTTGLGKYLSALPQDPTNNGALVYTYAGDATAQTFELNAVLEATDNQARMTTDGGNDDASYEVGTDPSLDLLSPTP